MAMPTIALFRRIASTRYIFLLSGLAFVLWSLAASVVPKSSALSALLQPDLGETTATQHSTNANQGDASTPNSLNIRPKFGFGIAHARVFVVSLAGRQDRREQMEFLRATQDLTWTVVDAIPGNATLVSRILDWVAHRRAEDKEAGASGFRWPEEIDALSASHSPLNRSGSDAWEDKSPPSNPKNSKSLHLMTPRLPCATEDDTIPTFVDDTPEWMVLSPAKIACWHSHVSAVRRFVDEQDADGHRSKDDVAFILEDDIDMEKDVSTKLSRLWTFLPVGWDIVFLGHCWSDESYYPSLTAFPDTNLHPSHSPKCTHAYALSLSGARRLLQHLRYPPFAYSRALDQACAWLVQSGRLRGYSIVPSLVVQRKRASSDISPGLGSEWRERLRDGVLDA